MLSAIAYHGKNASRSWAPAVRYARDALSTSTPQRQRTLSLLLVAAYGGPVPCPQGTLSLVGWHMTVELYEYPRLGIPCATRRIEHLLLAFSKCRSNDWPMKPGEVSALPSCTESVSGGFQVPNVCWFYSRCPRSRRYRSVPAVRAYGTLAHLSLYQSSYM